MYGRLDDSVNWTMSMKSQEFTLVVEVANTTGKKQMLSYLEDTQANVIIFVEHRVLKDEIPDLMARLLSDGWRSVWTPAFTTQAGGVLAGVVIMARRYLGLVPLKDRNNN